MERSRKKNEESQEHVNHKIEINSIKYHLGKFDKIREEFGEVQKTLLEKINKLLQKEDKFDTLINMSEQRWNSYLRMRGNEKDESTRMLNEQIIRIDQLTERMDTLFVEPLNLQRPSKSFGLQNLKDKGH